MKGLNPAPEGWRYVIRFEDAKGRGPWQWGTGLAPVHVYDRAQRTRNPYHSAGDMPGPWSDEGIRPHHERHGCKGYVFGFASVAQLKAAFRSGVGRQAMADKTGTFPKIFLVPEQDVIDGNAQVLFRETRRDRFVGILDPRTLEPNLVRATALAA